MSKTNTKTPKTGKYSRQWVRTANNSQKARTNHQKNHPNDAQAIKNWEMSPIKYNK